MNIRAGGQFQIVLLRALSLRIPEYGHLSLILGSDGTPLSKRHGSHSVRELRDAGYFPAALNNYLARLGHSYDNNNFMTLPELAAEFHIGKIGRSPARFDESQLHYWQQQAIAHAHSHELWEWMGPAVHELVSAAQRDEFIAAIRTNVFLPEHALLWARILYSDPLEWMLGARQVIAQAGKIFFEYALTALEHQPNDFKSLADEIKQSLGVSGKALYQPLRAAFTGELDGPEMARLLPLLGEERARKRLEAALTHCVSQSEK
ncbi:MAG: glutamate--tRNA ligase family protein [Gammaproteobacteria bacterium]|nr:glutamate--tRNA ligase family protein [Gammaproteobacteria bacterium]